MLGDANFVRHLVPTTLYDMRWKVFAVVAGAVALITALVPPTVRQSPFFVAAAVGVCGQAGVLVAPRVLWAQFEVGVHWEDVCHDHRARTVLLVLSNIVTVVGLAICVTVLTMRYHAGDLLSMTTVAEIGSTLFLVERAQGATGRPALALGRYLARRRERMCAEDLVRRPPMLPEPVTLAGAGHLSHVSLDGMTIAVPSPLYVQRDDNV